MIGFVQSAVLDTSSYDFTDVTSITTYCSDIETGSYDDDIYYCKYFTESVYFDYWEAFTTGAKLSQFYEYSDKCTNATNYILDAFYGYYYNITCEGGADLTCDTLDNQLFYWSKSV